MYGYGRNEVILPTGIWLHNKTQRRYFLIGIGSLIKDLDEFRPMSNIGRARFTESPEHPLLIHLATGAIRPGGQLVIDNLGVSLRHVKPTELFAVYADMQNSSTDEPHLWVRPLVGPAGWMTPALGDKGVLIERYTFETAVTPLPYF